eukprot:6172388-Pleurochrysis_carterae.AAC.4
MTSLWIGQTELIYSSRCCSKHGQKTIIHCDVATSAQYVTRSRRFFSWLDLVEVEQVVHLFLPHAVIALLDYY